MLAVNSGTSCEQGRSMTPSLLRPRMSSTFPSWMPAGPPLPAPTLHTGFLVPSARSLSPPRDKRCCEEPFSQSLESHVLLSFSVSPKGSHQCRSLDFEQGPLGQSSVTISERAVVLGQVQSGTIRHTRGEHPHAEITNRPVHKYVCYRPLLKAGMFFTQLFLRKDVSTAACSRASCSRPA